METREAGSDTRGPAIFGGPDKTQIDDKHTKEDFKMKIDAITKQKIIIAMDIAGYEQDGRELEFVNLNNGKREIFKTWNEVCDFIVNWAKQNSFGFILCLYGASLFGIISA